MKRKNRNLLRGFSFGFMPFPLFAAFTNDPANTLPTGEGNDTLPAGGGTGGGGNPPAKTYTAAEWRGIVKERDRFKKQMRAIARTLGIEPDSLEFVETNDPENPLTIEGDEIEELLAAVEKFRADKSGNPGDKKRADDEKKKRLLRPVERRAEVAESKVAALIKWIERNAVIPSIRLACRENQAVDDDGGQYSDIVKLVLPKMPVKVEFDDDDKSANVVTGAMNDDGTDFESATGDPMQDANALVSALLNSKPKFKNANFRPGPGAGGARTGNQNSQNGARQKNIADSVQMFTGVRPASAGKS